MLRYYDLNKYIFKYVITYINKIYNENNGKTIIEGIRLWEKYVLPHCGRCGPFLADKFYTYYLKRIAKLLEDNDYQTSKDFLIKLTNHICSIKDVRNITIPSLSFLSTRYNSLGCAVGLDNKGNTTDVGGIASDLSKETAKEIINNIKTGGKTGINVIEKDVFTGREFERYDLQKADLVTSDDEICLNRKYIFSTLELEWPTETEKENIWCNIINTTPIAGLGFNYFYMNKTSKFVIGLNRFQSLNGPLSCSYEWYTYDDFKRRIEYKYANGFNGPETERSSTIGKSFLKFAYGDENATIPELK